MTRRSAGALIALVGVAAAPARASERDGQLWNTVTAVGTLGKDVEVGLDVSARYFEDVSYLGQLLVRPTVTYRISPTVSVTGGYVYSRNDTSTDTRSHEHRALQQLLVRLLRTERGFELATRTRVEQRVREGQPGVAFRLRQQLRGQLPLGEAGLRVTGSCEVLVEVNGPEWGSKRGVEQLRAAAGLILPISNTLSAEAGYMNMRQFRRGENRVNDIATLALAIRF